MESEPPGRVLVVKVAMPFAPSVPVPSCIAPSRKVTVPVGVIPLPARVAAKVTEVPKTTVAAEAVRPIVGAMGFTVRLSAAEVAAE